MAFQQATQTNLTGTGTTIVKAYDNNVIAGNMLVLGASHSDNTQSIATVTDSQGNAWVQRAMMIGASNFNSYLWQAVASTTGACTVTVTFSATAGNRELCIAEYDGMEAIPFDAASAGNEGSTNAPNSGSLTSAVDGDTVVGVFWVDVSGATVTAGSNLAFTKRAESAGVTHCVLEEGVQSVAGAVSADLSLSAVRDWNGVAAAFKPTGFHEPIYRQNRSSVPPNVRIAGV